MCIRPRKCTSRKLEEQSFCCARIGLARGSMPRRSLVVGIRERNSGSGVGLSAGAGSREKKPRLQRALVAMIEAELVSPRTTCADGGLAVCGWWSRRCRPGWALACDCPSRNWHSSSCCSRKMQSRRAKAATPSTCRESNKWRRSMKSSRMCWAKRAGIELRLRWTGCRRFPRAYKSCAKRMKERWRRR